MTRDTLLNEINIQLRNLDTATLLSMYDVVYRLSDNSRNGVRIFTHLDKYTANKRSR